MPTEPEKQSETPRRPRKRTRPKPDDDGFVVFEVDGFAQLTPEQRTWPVVDFKPAPPKADPPAAPGEQSSPT